MKTVIAALALLPVIGYGAIEPAIIGFANANATYTVPSGKVLVIQSVGTSYQYSSVNIFMLTFTSDTSTNEVAVFRDNSINLNPIPLDPPINVPSGTTIKARNAAIGGVSTTIMGLLVDPSDLYVTMESSTDNIKVADGNFSFDVITSSARPARLSVTGSPDLETWSPVDAVVAKKSTDTYSVTLPADQEQYFASHTAIIAGD